MDASVPYSNRSCPPYPYERTSLDPDVIPCATGAGPRFIRRAIGVGEELDRLTKLYGPIVL